VGVRMLTDRRFGWHPLEAAPSPSVPLSPLDDIFLVLRRRGGGEVEGEVSGTAVASCMAVCCPDEGKHSTDEVNTVLTR
jgi:hypothetical protein